MKIIDATLDRAFEALLVGVPAGGLALSTKCIEWAFEASDEETSMLLGTAGIVGAAFAAAGIYGAIKIIRES